MRMILWVLRNVLIGAAIGGAAFAVYSHRPASDLPDRPAAETQAHSPEAPERTPIAMRRSMTIRAGPDGHYSLDARVNGTGVRFLVDTGATEVVLRREDAERVGLHVREHNFTGRAQTANGIVRTAPVVLRDLRVGRLAMRNVDASINGGPLHQSLLGMSFLRRLDGYEVVDDKLILYW
jgi:aspartyl protease family protein